MSVSKIVNLRLCVGLTGAGLLCFAGCHQEQRAIDLYVDAVMLQQLEEPEMAIEKLKQAVESNKRFPLAYSMLGETYEQTNDYERSAVCYEKAVELNPWSFKDHFNLGRVRQNMKQFEQAAKAYGRACELEPGHLDAHIRAAKCYCQIRDYRTALTHAERAEQIDRNASGVQLLLAEIYQSQEDYDRAIPSYKRALAMDTNNPKIMVPLAVAYLRTHRYGSARDLLILVTQIQPDNSAAYRSLGYCYLKLDDLNRAVASYGRAINLNSRDWEARRGLGVVYMVAALRQADRLLRSKAIEQWRLSLDIESSQPHHETLLRLIRTYSR